jgi:hypothetical protein
LSWADNAIGSSSMIRKILQAFISQVIEVSTP